MSDRLHIIINGETESVYNLFLSKRTIQVVSLFSLLLLLLLGGLVYNAFHLSHTNTVLTNQVQLLSNRLEKNSLVKEQLALKVSHLQQLNSEQAETFQKEKTTLLSTAVTELEERSNLIERIMCNLGLDPQDLSKESKLKLSGSTRPKKKLLLSCWKQLFRFLSLSN